MKAKPRIARSPVQLIWVLRQGAMLSPIRVSWALVEGPNFSTPPEKKKSQEIKGRFFLRKYDVFFSLPKKYAENYPEEEILKLSSV